MSESIDETTARLAQKLESKYRDLQAQAAQAAHSDGTLDRVYVVLSMMGFTEQRSLEIVNEILNAGIVFRDVRRV